MGNIDWSSIGGLCCLGIAVSCIFIGLLFEMSSAPDKKSAETYEQQHGYP